MSSSEEAISALLKANDEQLVHSPEWYNQLLDIVNDLINSDFNKLIHILYRMDVSEQKIKDLLLKSPTSDAATFITNLMLERQLQKIRTKNSFSAKDVEISPDEKW